MFSVLSLIIIKNHFIYAIHPSIRRMDAASFLRYVRCALPAAALLSSPSVDRCPRYDVAAGYSLVSSAGGPLLSRITSRLGPRLG